MKRETWSMNLETWIMKRNLGFKKKIKKRQDRNTAEMGSVAVVKIK